MLETKIVKIEQITLAPNTFYYMDLLAGTHELYGAIPHPWSELYGTYNILIENYKSYYVELIESQQFLSPMNTRVRLLLNADNDDAKNRWQNFGYIGEKIPLNR